MPRPVATSWVSCLWASVISAEVAASQLALSWLYASPFSYRSDFLELWARTLALPHVDPWFDTVGFADALLTAERCTFASACARVGLDLVHFPAFEVSESAQDRCF